MQRRVAGERRKETDQDHNKVGREKELFPFVVCKIKGGRATTLRGIKSPKKQLIGC